MADIVGMFSWGGISEASIQQGDSALCKMRENGMKLSDCFSLKEDFGSGLVPRFNSNGELVEVFANRDSLQPYIDYQDTVCIDYKEFSYYLTLLDMVRDN